MDTAQPVQTDGRKAAAGPPPAPGPALDPAPAPARRPNWVEWLTTTDHKKIGTMYLVSALAFFVVGGVLALVMRAELARPGTQILSNEQFNQAFTMHGSIMLLMFAMPLFTGFANWIMPLQTGAPDVAFPRLNMLSFWAAGAVALRVRAAVQGRREVREAAGEGAELHQVKKG